MALLEVTGLRKSFAVTTGRLRKQQLRAVDGVGFDVAAGQTLGLVGESGSGKSTAGLSLLRLTEPDAGSIVFDGVEVTGLRGRDLRAVRRDMQMVFQNPFASLNPSMTVADLVGEPLEIHDLATGAGRDARVLEALTMVGLGDQSYLRRYPHEFSGGQRQRIAIARVLVLQPKLIVADEAVSALDVSTQSGIVNLFQDLQESLGIAYVFISHDLSVVRHVSDRVAVMYLGRIVELGPVDEVYARPQHPYTAALLAAIPVPNPAVQRQRERIVLRGEPPVPTNVPPGCRFHRRCPYAMELCARVDPELTTHATGHQVACHLHTEGPALAGGTVLSVTPNSPQPETAHASNQ